MIDFNAVINKNLKHGPQPIEISGHKLTDNEAIAVYRMTCDHLIYLDDCHPSELSECEIIPADESLISGALGSLGTYDNLLGKRVVVAHENGHDYINVENKDLSAVWGRLAELAG